MVLMVCDDTSPRGTEPGSCPILPGRIPSAYRHGGRHIDYRVWTACRHKQQVARFQVDFVWRRGCCTGRAMTCVCLDMTCGRLDSSFSRFANKHFWLCSATGKDGFWRGAVVWIEQGHVGCLVKRPALHSFKERHPKVAAKGVHVEIAAEACWRDKKTRPGVTVSTTGCQPLQ